MRYTIANGNAVNLVFDSLTSSSALGDIVCERDIKYSYLAIAPVSTDSILHFEGGRNGGQKGFFVTT